MPTYDFRNKDTGEVIEKYMSISTREQYLLDNPHMEAYLSSVNLVHEPGSRLKVDDGFREVISKIKSTHKINSIKDH